MSYQEGMNGLADFKVVCDPPTQADIDKNRINLSIWVKPTQPITYYTFPLPGIFSEEEAKEMVDYLNGLQYEEDVEERKKGRSLSD